VKEMMYRLKEIREKRRISQTELANKAKVTRATISKIENGEEVEVKIGTLENLAKALKCSVADFLCD
jgi:DNA-binding helix-turn-helix protein